MEKHRILYEGPYALAVPTATMLADADGVELMSSEAPERRRQDVDQVVLALTVTASTEAIVAAVARIQEDLPPGATITVQDP